MASRTKIDRCHRPWLPREIDLDTLDTIHPSIEASERRQSRATILVVDDNRDSVLSIAKLLELSGHSTIPAFSAREAVDLLDETPKIDLVLSDIRMPDVDGFDLLRVLRHRFPTLPIILMSGLPITSDDVIPSGASILQKPIAIEELQGLLRQKLAPSEGV